MGKLVSLQNRVVHKDDARYHGGKRALSSINMVIWHSTEGRNAAESMQWNNREGSPNRASAHYYVDRDGTIYRFLPIECIANHAGVSAWPIPKDGVVPAHSSVNAHSIGVELCGDIDDLTHMTARQLESAYWLGCTLWTYAVNSYNLAHKEVAPGRKFDPSDHFLSMPWWRYQLTQFAQPSFEEYLASVAHVV